MQIEEKAPDFKLKASDDTKVSLEDYRGKNIVLYFYPEDDTPGWISEANEFGELYNDFKEIDTVILGVSPDGIDSHKSFIKQLDIPYLLLSDTDKEVCKKYEIFKEDGIISKTGHDFERSTFIIDKEGQLIKEYRNVEVEGHAKEVYDFIKSNNK